MQPARPLITTLLLLALLPATASAVPTLDGEFPVDAKPEHMVLGPDGNVWFTMGNDEFGRITPDGTVSDDFAMPGGATPTDITAGGNRLWIAHNGGFAEVDPANPAAPTDHPVAQISSSRGIAREPADGDLWIVDPDDGTVAEIGSDGTFKRDVAGESINAGTPSGRDIVAGSDGRMWWIDFAQKAVQATNPAGAGSSDGFAFGVGNPQEIAAGPAGQLAFSSPSDNVGRVATADGAIQLTDATGTDATGVAFGADGAYWFGNVVGDTLGRLTTDGAFTKPITFPAGSIPRYVAAGANNTLWVTLEQVGSERIARITGVDPPPAPEEPPPGPGPEQPGPGPGPSGPPPDTLAPVLAANPTLSRSRFRVGQRTTITVGLSEAASLTLRFQRLLGGRRRRGQCVRPRRSLRRAPRCTRFVAAGTLTRAGVAGNNLLAFNGRIGRRGLPAGRYLLTLIARDAAGNESAAVTLRFRILRRRR